MTEKLKPFLISALIFLLDRVTKIAVRNRVGFMDNIPVIPGFFSIVHSENPGAAFGMFADSTSPLRPFFLVVLSLVVMGFISMMLLKPGLSAGWPMRIGLALVLGGAMGNVFDRVLAGTVTDFLEFYFGSYTFAAFNVADSAISVGAVLLLIDMWLGARRERAHVSQTN
jgi:signal peptidase II